jgi:phage protein D
VIDTAIARVTGYVKNALEQARRDAANAVPAFRLTVDGNDIAQLISPRLMNLELTDNRGIEADQLSITLSDHDGLLAIPPKGATLRLWLGWSDTGLVDKGTYTVDETEHSGAPDVLSIRARSADLRTGLKTKRECSWSNTTLGEVLGAKATDSAVRAHQAKHSNATVTKQPIVKCWIFQA